MLSKIQKFTDVGGDCLPMCSAAPLIEWWLATPNFLFKPKNGFEYQFFIETQEREIF